ncbi:MAG: hypothetical protein FGM50_12315, partial [Mycobacterium sp.]|nr:hypothetical protein [Mycobacterium sp.]
STVDRLRGYADPVDSDRPAYNSVVLAAADPANPYGAALPWPSTDGGHRPSRKAGALVVLVDGALAFYVERGGRSLLTFTADREVQAAAAGTLAHTVASGRLGGILVEKVDGVSVLEAAHTSTSDALISAGFARTPRGLRIR